MAYHFLPCDREQPYLMPPSVKEWLPQGDLAWFLLDAVGEMELGAFYAPYRADGNGRPAYEPRMMVGLLLYAYCEAERMLAQAAAKDAEEDARYGKDKRGDELPEELRDPKSRLARLKECKERLEREAQEKAAVQEEKIRKRQEEEATTGQKVRGRKPAEPDPEPPEEAKGNVTDPQSRVMK
ncbi:MAG: IS1182 family transposase, partial [Planctomycetes bacterium]|nr:IS1182 family transposase [Planctomycetota bacterium]